MSKKDSYWFRHDSTAGRGLRMRKMAHIYGHWGKGVYWDIIEILRDQIKYSFDSDDASLQMLCDLIGCKDESKFINWFKDCIKLDLFQQNKGKFYSEILCKNMQKWDIYKANGEKGGRPEKPKRNQKHNQTDNLNETIIEYNITEQDRTEEYINKEKEFLSSDIWLESIAMSLRLKTKEEALSWAQKFILEMKAKENWLGRDLKELKHHCVNWIKIELSKEQKGFVKSIDEIYVKPKQKDYNSVTERLLALAKK